MSSQGHREWPLPMSIYSFFIFCIQSISERKSRKDQR
nr:MAG TPA: hypothetical protein [Caudoviricetes sp.]